MIYLLFLCQYYNFINLLYSLYSKFPCVCVLFTQLCPILCNPMDCSPPGSSVPRILQARILEWVAIFLFQGIFLTQGSNLGLLHCRRILYHLSYRESPNFHNLPNILHYAWICYNLFFLLDVLYNHLVSFSPQNAIGFKQGYIKYIGLFDGE